MTILDKYIIRNFLGTLIFSLVAFSIIFIIIDLVGYLDKFIDKDVPRVVIVKYYFYYLPYIIVLSLPVAMLLASLFSMGQMARYNEIVAMTASGISINRILLPLFILGFIISCFIMYSGEKIVPLTNEKKIGLYNQYVHKSKKRIQTRYTDIYVQLSQNQWLNIGHFDTKINTGYKVAIQNFDEQFKAITQRIDAPQMVRENDKWVIINGITRNFKNNKETIEKFERLERPDFQFEAKDISKVQKKTEEMSYWDLKKFIENVKRNGGDPDRWLVDLYLKISFPFANFIIVMFGAPLASRKTRSGPAISFGISLVICFLYFGIIKVSQTFGHNGTISPLLAAWLGNMIFGVAALAILYKVRK